MLTINHIESVRGLSRPAMKIFFLILALTLLSASVNKSSASESSSDVSEPEITFMNEGWYDTDVLRQEIEDAREQRYRQKWYDHFDEIEARFIV